jgi:G:T-mismatch repair DNA endonuclease (very short patch repair protein)
MINVSNDARKKMSEAQKRRFQRPEELKKLARARSLQTIDYKERVKLMNRAFLKKYGSFLELTKMGLRAPKRKPNRLEIEVAKLLGSEWLFVGKGDLVVGGLIPDFVHKERKEIVEALGCYFHACPAHFPNVRIERTARPEYREQVYTRYGYKVTFLWEHTVKAQRKLAFAESGVKDPSIYAKA